MQAGSDAASAPADPVLRTVQKGFLRQVFGFLSAESGKSQQQPSGNPATGSTVDGSLPTGGSDKEAANCGGRRRALLQILTDNIPDYAFALRLLFGERWWLRALSFSAPFCCSLAAFCPAITGNWLISALPDLCICNS